MDLTQGKADSTHSPEDDIQREEEGNKEEGDRQCNSIGGNTVAIYMSPIFFLSHTEDRKSTLCMREDACLEIITKFIVRSF